MTSYLFELLLNFCPRWRQLRIKKTAERGKISAKLPRLTRGAFNEIFPAIK